MKARVHDQRSQGKRLVVLGGIILLVISAAVLWILNIQAVIPGPWAKILGVLFTVLGVLIALVQVHHQFSPNPLSHTLSTNLLPDHIYAPYAELVGTTIPKRKGTFIVLTKKILCGVSIHLSPGFDAACLNSLQAANVVEYEVQGTTFFLAIFPSVEPGNYTVFTDRPHHETKVTVSAGRITVVDWRYKAQKGFITLLWNRLLRIGAWDEN